MDCLDKKPAIGNYVIVIGFYALALLFMYFLTQALCERHESYKSQLLDFDPYSMTIYFRSEFLAIIWVEFLVCYVVVIAAVFIAGQLILATSEQKKLSNNPNLLVAFLLLAFIVPAMAMFNS